jgi:hypothetical protein
MKTYTCTCGQLIFFENVTCVACGRELGFLPDVLRLSSLEPAENGLFKAAEAKGKNHSYRKCQNYAKESVCNWMIPAGNSEAQDKQPFCVSCRLNQTIPDLTIQQNHALWGRMETAKHRLVYSLLNLKLPIANKTEDPKQGLDFAFLSDVVKPDGSLSKVLTGHDNGLITLNVAEADDAAREKMRLAMKEPYRTLLGHFRHEIGHYSWDRLVCGTGFLKRYHELFGNGQADYADALQRYYSGGAPANWQDNYISAYATSHPWEDWAETWAHFMHIQDALEVASDFGLAGKTIRIDPKLSTSRPWLSSRQNTFEEIVGAWSELAIALNSINRSMGLQDTYPFVLSPAVINKLHFVFEVISAGARKSAAAF